MAVLVSGKTPREEHTEAKGSGRERRVLDRQARWRGMRSTGVLGGAQASNRQRDTHVKIPFVHQEYRLCYVEAWLYLGFFSMPSREGRANSVVGFGNTLHKLPVLTCKSQLVSLHLEEPQVTFLPLKHRNKAEDRVSA